MENDYKILGVSKNATDDEVRLAYRNLARKYHPDNFKNDEELRNIAERKLNEINNAYDNIMQSRKQGVAEPENNDTHTNNYQSNERSDRSPIYDRVRQLLSVNNLAEAENMLNSIDTPQRGAKWHFLYGQLCYRRGYLMEARTHFVNAVDMDPTNDEYKQALNYMSKGANNYGPYNSGNQNYGCSPCGVCQSLICADCCCECMGGDLISCC